MNSFQYNMKFIPEENEIGEFLEKIKKFGKIYCSNQDWIESNIIKSLHDKEKLKTWIYKDGIINSKLIYRLTRDTESLNKFHQLCDNIENNLIIIETENNNIFGCYCPWSWDTSGNDCHSEKESIFFSLTKDQKYYYEKNLKYHKGCKDHGPYIHNNFYFNKTMKNCIILNNKYIDKTGNYDVKEFEFYQIIDKNND